MADTIQHYLFKYCFFMKKFIFATFLTVTLFTASALSANAVNYGGYGIPCEPIYGGGQTCVSKGNLVINKTVENPSNKEFVDNLSQTTDPKFGPGDTVTFQLTVVNTGGQNFSEVTVTDTLPNFLTFVSGPGTFDSNNRKLTFKINDLGAGESRTYTINTKVNSNIPNDPAVNCVINNARAVSDIAEASDISQVCLQNTGKGGFQVLGTPTVKQTPATGPEMFSLLGLIPAAISGLFLRRKASK